MVWLFAIFFVLLLISATPLLGELGVRWTLQLMIALSVIFLIAGWALFIFYPSFS